MNKHQGFALIGILIAVLILGVSIYVATDRLAGESSLDLLNLLETTSEVEEGSTVSTQKVTVQSRDTGKSKLILPQEYDPRVHTIVGDPRSLDEDTIKALCRSETDITAEAANLKQLGGPAARAGLNTAYNICLAKFGVVEE